MKKILFILFSIFIGYTSSGSFSGNRMKLGNAEVIITKEKIEINTGIVKRTWRLTQEGLKSSELILSGSKNVINEKSLLGCWNLGDSQLILDFTTVELKKDNDQGFTNNFLKVIVNGQYQKSPIAFKYEIWVYPDAPGIRTQLFLKKNSEGQIPKFGLGTTELYGLKNDFTSVQAIGYYNDTQNRNTVETPLCREENIKLISSQLDVDWASLISFKQNDVGMILLKESPKCVNQKSINTGGFKFDRNIVSVYGAGLDENSITTAFQSCWATWTILYTGGQDEMQYALKMFDRIRYPVDKNKDIYIMANTWGSGDAGFNSKYSSREENILTEIESVKDLGIDVLQIDDGWQGLDYDSWQPVNTLKYINNKNQGTQKLPNETEYLVYPDGWRNVKEKAKKLNVKLGLWAASWIPYEDMMKNYEDGNFNYFKLDFAKLNTYDQFYDLVNKVRSFIVSTGHKVRINWDVTENDSRMGYYFGHEYGNIFLENRKPINPKNVVYYPSLVLRDAWNLAHFTNLNKFQICYQNVEMVNREVSDAYLYNQDYCLAITLMGTPLFFQETHLLAGDDRVKVRELIQTYKKYRDEMFSGFVYPIGDIPTNSSWTGFQNISEDKTHGYLIVFRERLNKEISREIPLKFLYGKNIQLQNLKNGEIQKLSVKSDGILNFNIGKGGDFLFYKYQIL